MRELPIACTLGPEALAARREGLLAELLRRSVAHNELPNGHRLAFDSADETLSLILRAVAAERRCCESSVCRSRWNPPDGH